MWNTERGLGRPSTAGEGADGSVWGMDGAAGGAGMGTKRKPSAQVATYLRRLTQLGSKHVNAPASPVAGGVAGGTRRPGARSPPRARPATVGVAGMRRTRRSPSPVASRGSPGAAGVGGGGSGGLSRVPQLTPPSAYVGQGGGVFSRTAPADVLTARVLAEQELADAEASEWAERKEGAWNGEGAVRPGSPSSPGMHMFVPGHAGGTLMPAGPHPLDAPNSFGSLSTLSTFNSLGALGSLSAHARVGLDMWTAEDVRLWLLNAGASHEAVEEFVCAGTTGADLADTTESQARALFGTAAGIRIFNRVQRLIAVGGATEAGVCVRVSVRVCVCACACAPALLGVHGVTFLVMALTLTLGV